LKENYIAEDHFQKVLKCKKFIDWCETFDVKDAKVNNIKIVYVFMFGPNVGFIDLVADV
jgi:ADP-sugar diphosphatase